MRKFPIVLATLTLAAGGTLGVAPSVMALEGWESLGVLEANVPGTDLAISLIKPEEGYFSMRPRNLTEGRRVTKLILATFDYRNGITMEQADHLATTLGEDATKDRKWTDVYFELGKDRAGAQNIGVTIGSKGTNFMERNPSDVVYFAILEENLDDPEVEPKWSRGKWDYRTCAHASARADEGTRECVLNYDYMTGGQFFMPSGRYEVEPGIITWAEELKQFGEIELDALEKILLENEKKKANGEGFSDSLIKSIENSFTQRLAKVERLGLTEVLAERIDGQLIRKQLLLTFFKPEETPKTDDGDEEGDKKKDESGGEASDEPETPEAKPGASSGGSGANREDWEVKWPIFKEEIVDVSDKKSESEGDEAQISVGETKTGTGETVVKNTNTDENRVDLGSLRITDKHPEVAMMEDEKNAADLAVPNLGEVENAQEMSGKWFWAIVIMLVGVSGVLGWRVIKYLLAKRTDKDREE